MPDTTLSKVQLRNTLRQRRRALSQLQQRNAANALTSSVTQLPGWDGAQRVAVYLAADGEIDTGPLVDLARSLDKDLFLPVMANDSSLTFGAWHANEHLTVNRYNIPEPPNHAPRISISDLDIMFMPLVGWDLFGGRLGMGGGFYDRTLSQTTDALLVGLAHDCQQVTETPRDTWDICLHFIATDSALHNCSAAQKH